MILALDPSFSSTGVAISSDKGETIETFRISRKGLCYKSITDNHRACKEIVEELLNKLNEYDDVFDVIIEYPALATRSGAYLAILNGFLAARLQLQDNIKSITWIPPTACDSFVRNKSHSKTYLVNWCKSKGLIKTRASHDECTALIFVELLKAIRNGEYKNSYFVWNK